MNRLKEIRKYLNFTQREFAKKLGVKQNTVSYWENGKRQIDIETAKKISAFAGCSVEYLIGNEEKSTSVPLVGETKEEEDYIIAQYENCFAMKVKGNEMEPFIMEDDIVIIKPTEKASDGDIVLMRTEDGKFVMREYVKFKDGIAFASRNLKYSPIFYASEEIKNLPIKIIGRVIEQRRKFSASSHRD